MKNILLISIVILFSSCGIIKKTVNPPQVKVKKVEISSMSLQEVNLNLNLEIENINSIDIELSRVEYYLEIEDKKIVEGFKGDAIKIKGKSVVNTKIPIKFKISEVIKSLGKSYEDSKIHYKVRLYPTIKIPILGDSRLPISFGGKIPLPKKPEIKLRDIKIKELSFRKIRFILDLELKGRGGVNMYLDNFLWSKDK